jgi:hypothetical protein
MISVDDIKDAFEQAYQIEISSVIQAQEEFNKKGAEDMADMAVSYMLGLGRAKEILSIILKDI